MSNSERADALAHTTIAEIEALSFAIFAISTWLHPEASDPADIDRLEDRAQDVIDVLLKMRTRKQRVQRLFELTTSDGPVPCLCGHCKAADA